MKKPVRIIYFLVNGNPDSKRYLKSDFTLDTSTSIFEAQEFTQTPEEMETFTEGLKRKLDSNFYHKCFASQSFGDVKFKEITFHCEEYVNPTYAPSFARICGKIVNGISRHFRISRCGQEYLNENGEAVVSYQHFSMSGPRMLIVHKDPSRYQLTGMFAVNVVSVDKGRSVTCKPVYFGRPEGSTVYFGKAAYHKLEEISPRRPPHTPMYQDDSGFSCG